MFPAWCKTPVERACHGWPNRHCQCNRSSRRCPDNKGASRSWSPKRLIRQNPVVRRLSVVGAQRIDRGAAGRVEDVDLEPAAGAGLHRDENGVGGRDQWGPIVRVAPGVVQVDGGRPVDRIQVLRRWAIVRRVLSIAGEGGLCPGLADQQKCEPEAGGYPSQFSWNVRYRTLVPIHHVIPFRLLRTYGRSREAATLPRWTSNQIPSRCGFRKWRRLKRHNHPTIDRLICRLVAVSRGQSRVPFVRVISVKAEECDQGTARPQELENDATIRARSPGGTHKSGGAARSANTRRHPAGPLRNTWFQQAAPPYAPIQLFFQ